PDEEIGRGAHKFDVEKFGADWAYTMDGSQIGELEYENFNAAGVKLVFKGKSVHPGYAKGKMINSMLLANKFISKLPSKEVPEKTTGYEGFFHVHDITGSLEETEVQLIIRDHSMKKFKKRKKFIRELVNKFNKKYISYEVFFKLNNITGSIEEKEVQIIIRNKRMKKLKKRKKFIRKLLNKFNKKYAKKFGDKIEDCEIKDQYYNIKEKVEPVMH